MSRRDHPEAPPPRGARSGSGDRLIRGSSSSDQVGKGHGVRHLVHPAGRMQPSCRPLFPRRAWFCHRSHFRSSAASSSADGPSEGEGENEAERSRVEIERLKRELAQARKELQDATNPSHQSSDAASRGRQGARGTGEGTATATVSATPGSWFATGPSTAGSSSDPPSLAAGRGTFFASQPTPGGGRPRPVDSPLSKYGSMDAVGGSPAATIKVSVRESAIQCLRTDTVAENYFILQSGSLAAFGHYSTA